MAVAVVYAAKELCFRLRQGLLYCNRTSNVGLQLYVVREKKTMAAHPISNFSCNKEGVASSCMHERNLCFAPVLVIVHVWHADRSARASFDFGALGDISP
jgi:hypothetical protein